MKSKIMLSIVLVFFVVSTVYALTEKQRENLEKTLDLAKDDKEKYERVLELLERKNVDLSDEKELSERIQNDMERLDIKGFQGFKTEEPSPKKSKFSWVLVPVVLVIVSIFGVAEFHRKKGKTLRLHELAQFHDVHKPHDELEKVENYIRECLHFGYPQEQIQKILLERGWKEEIINEAFGMLKR